MTIKHLASALAALCVGGSGLAHAALIELNVAGASDSGDTTFTLTAVLDDEADATGFTGSGNTVGLFDPDEALMSFSLTLENAGAGQSLTLTDADLGFDGFRGVTQGFSSIFGGTSFGLIGSLGGDTANGLLSLFLGADGAVAPNLFTDSAGNLLDGVLMETITLDLLNAAGLSLNANGNTEGAFAAIIAVDSSVTDNNLELRVNTVAFNAFEEPAAVPLPAAAFLFLPAAGLLAAARRRSI